LKEADLPDPIRKEAERELSRLKHMPAATPDFQMTRRYLELVMELPWKKGPEDRLDLPAARQVLDEDHYDLAPIKERILEHLAVHKLNPEAKAPIISFVGPPGVGKTSLGQSIARAMGRSFERISLGRMHDEAELRSHCRTYIGAMPGRGEFVELINCSANALCSINRRAWLPGWMTPWSTLTTHISPQEIPHSDFRLAWSPNANTIAIGRSSFGAKNHEISKPSGTCLTLERQ
jgi:hypothetical protein